MGPWTHGSWARGDGRVVGNLDFGAEVSAWYREHVEFPFFMQHLKDKTLEPVAEATMFETGTNRWRTFAAWPPQTAADDDVSGCARRRCRPRRRPKPRPSTST